MSTFSLLTRTTNYNLYSLSRLRLISKFGRAHAVSASFPSSETEVYVFLGFYKLQQQIIYKHTSEIKHTFLFTPIHLKFYLKFSGVCFQMIACMREKTNDKSQPKTATFFGFHSTFRCSVHVTLFLSVFFIHLHIFLFEIERKL